MSDRKTAPSLYEFVHKQIERTGWVLVNLVLIKQLNSQSS